MKHLRYFIQYCFFKTRFFPVTLLTQSITALCLNRIVASLRLHPKIRSIYLIRGQAKKEAVFGLSDIDLMIILHEGDDDPMIIPKIKKSLSRLRFFFRGMIAPSNEIGMMPLEGLKKFGQDHDWYAIRLLEAFDSWKILYGEDILPLLKKEDALENIYLSLAWEVNQSWGLTIDGRRVQEQPPAFMRQYQQQKGVSDLCRLYLLSSQGILAKSRREALEIMGLQAAPPDMNFSLRMVRDVYRKIETLPVFRKEKVRLENTLTIDDILPKSYASKIQDTVRKFGRDWAREIKRVSLIPQIEFRYNVLELNDYYNRLKFKEPLGHVPAAHLDHAEFYPVYLVLDAPDELSASCINALLELIGQLRGWLEIYPYQLLDQMALPLIKNYKQELKPVKTPCIDPAFFFLAAQKSFLLVGDSPLMGISEDDLYVCALTINAAERYLESIAPLLKYTSLVKTCTPGFIRFFLTAMRAKILLATGAQHAAQILFTPKAIFDYLDAHEPRAKTWLRRFEHEIQKCLAGRPCDAPLFFNKALKLIDDAPAPAPTPLQNPRVSVIIITADRKNDIVECLDSLMRQSRMPDELVIIDNGAHEWVDEAIEPYMSPLKIRYFRREKRGIPMARNAGLEQATGDILAFIDDDCVADPRWLEQLVQPFLEDPQVGIVGGYLSGIGRTDKIVEKYYDFTLMTKFGLEG